jgi:hypothetical protein
LAVAIIAIVRGVVGSIRISVVTEPQAADETIAAIMETLMPLAKAIVHTREAAVKSAKFPTMESANSGTVEATKSAAVKPAAESAAMETAAPAMETPAAVSAPTPAPAMPSVGEIWLAERGSAQQSSCDRQSLSVLRPGPIFV